MVTCPCCEYQTVPAGSILCGDCTQGCNCAKDYVAPTPPAFTTKDSGLREDFSTGARRDVQQGKPRYDLIPLLPLRRLAELYARGAEKYGEGNFEKGIPYRRVYASLFRHLAQWAEGDRTEDHLAAVAWNAFALMFYEGQVAKGKLPATLDDMKE